MANLEKFKQLKLAKFVSFWDLGNWNYCVAKLNLRLIQALNSLRVKLAVAKNSKYLLIVLILKEVSKNQRKKLDQIYFEYTFTK